MMGTAFQKFTEGLKKTRASLMGTVQRAIVAKSAVDEELLQEVEDILLSGDVGVKTASLLIGNIRRRVKMEKYVSSEELTGLLRDEIARVLVVNGSGDPGELKIPDGVRPFVILVVGVNGAGKTTTIGKLAHRFRVAGHSVVIGAADTFRAAASEQLEVWAKRAGVELIQQAHGADPASVAYDALSSAIARNADVVLIDTAGRLHTRVNLMEELAKIHRVLGKKLPGAPHETLLVMDATTGQNGLQQVRQFTDAAGVTGLVLTKLDGTARGGIVLGIATETNIPVRYIGVGEQLDDLQPFDRRAFVDALFETAR